jgi:hypothetical protein
MFGAAKRNLAGLKRSQPGRRFQNKYNSAHRKGANRSAGLQLLRIGLAVVALVIGVVCMFLPAPGILFLAMAGALLAPESRRLAVGLDWTELKLRAGMAWAKRTWARLDWFARGVVILAGGLVAVALGRALWRHFFG